MNYKTLLPILTLLTQFIKGRSASRNRFQYGCLPPKLDADTDQSRKRRVCNSDDETTEYCEVSKFAYPELRIHNGNWESSIVYAWITQIVLMELGRVPVTVGLRTNDTTSSSFYNPKNTMVYSEVMYPWDGLETANGVDCNSVNEPCVHFLPEVWSSRRLQYEPMIKKGTIYSPSLNGLWAKSGLYIPEFTARQHGQMLIWHGLSGDENRKVLAETFRRPTNWTHYCTTVSSSQCKVSDNVTERSPNPDEEGLYFSEGNFTGYFQFTDQNNCTENPNCTGTVLGPPCDWAFNLDSVLFWKNISGLSMDGPLPGGRYTTKQLQQIWHAASATNSHVIMYWYEPNPFLLKFSNSKYASQRVRFPPASIQCLKYLPTEVQRCSPNPTERRGDERGSCLLDTQSLQSILARSVGYDTIQSDNVDRSPAYDILKHIKVSNLDLTMILEGMAKGLDPRQLVCSWVVENRNMLEEYIPLGFPRHLEESVEYSTWITVLALVFGAFVIAVAFLAMFLIGKYSKTKTMVYAQPVFLYLILMGQCMYCFGAILYSVEPSELSCNAANWLTILGYTIEQVPILLKTAAIHRLVISAKKRQRINICRKVMLLKVAVIMLGVAAYMTIWTIIDPSIPREKRRMDTDDISTIIVNVACGSNEFYWQTILLSWQGILLIMAAVLAFQSRQVMKQFNESSSLAFMVYCHFVFLCARVILAIIYFRDSSLFSDAVLAGLLSFAISWDAMLAMIIYIFPKIFYSIMHPEHYKTTMIRERSSFVSNISSLNSDELRVLVCTANLGNTEPTEESLAAWIPSNGECCKVTSLKHRKGMPTKTFDIIAIGMQEATWGNTGKNLGSNRGGERSLRIMETIGDQATHENMDIQDVLSAMDDVNTSLLHDMIQKILGTGYIQIAAQQRGQMRFLLWASDMVANNIIDVKISGANTGVGKVLANKGGIVVSLNYKNTRISFLSAHLAAHEGETNYKARCENITSILREGRTYGLSKKLDDSVMSHHMFIFGDLNFRVNFGTEAKHQENVTRALEMIDKKDYVGLYGFDELQAGLSNGDLLAGFETPVCNFPPTFKVLPEQGFVYKKQRTPSYTDRILFKSAESLHNKLKVLAYESCEDFITSDHKPVRGAFSIIPNEVVDGTESRLSGTYTLTIRQMKGWDFPAGDLDGFSDPYLMFMWDSEGVSFVSKSLSHRLRMLVYGKSWPRTKYISKTLNPDWGDAEMLFTLEDVHVGQMLYIAAIDYDAFSKDDSLGVVSLSLKELIVMSEFEQKVEKTLIWGGKEGGKIQFEVTVQRMKKARRTTVFLSGTRKND
mmetsp:Transcript_10760/g.15838  ORF Transcript_10760/g.15838 Transcript_10760/m.15838 type:complete len:1306 (-) Transcript_10760:473-4390(-)